MATNRTIATTLDQSYCEVIEALAEKEGVPLAEIIRRAIKVYAETLGIDLPDSTVKHGGDGNTWPNRLTTTDAATIRQLHSEGLSYRAIADIFGVSFQAVAFIIKGRSHRDTE